MSRAVQCISAHVALIGTTSALTYPLGSLLCGRRPNHLHDHQACL